MANRVLRDWTTSETMDVLSPSAEVFFTRLIMKADDYGSFHENAKLLKAALFPLKDVSIKQISGWLAECVSANLIFVYEVDRKQYIRIRNFGQRLQNMRNAFPAPLNDSPEVTVSHGESRPETKRNRNEVETESETNPKPAVAVPFVGEVLKAWNDWEQHKREKKQKLTPTSIKRQIKFLGGRGDPEIIQILNYAIEKNWSGLYEIPKQNGNLKASIREFGPDAAIEHGKELIDRPGFSRNYSDG